MQDLYYAVTINALQKHVWETMIDPEKYTQWVKAFLLNSQFIGKWRQGAEV